MAVANRRHGRLGAPSPSLACLRRLAELGLGVPGRASLLSPRFGCGMAVANRRHGPRERQAPAWRGCGPLAELGLGVSRAGILAISALRLGMAVANRRHGRLGAPSPSLAWLWTPRRAGARRSRAEGLANSAFRLRHGGCKPPPRPRERQAPAWRGCGPLAELGLGVPGRASLLSPRFGCGMAVANRRHEAATATA